MVPMRQLRRRRIEPAVTTVPMRQCTCGAAAGGPAATTATMRLKHQRDDGAEVHLSQVSKIHFSTFVSRSINFEQFRREAKEHQFIEVST